MAIQTITATPGSGMSPFDFSSAWRFGPDRDDLCTELRRYYWVLVLRSCPRRQINAAYRRWMSVQAQLFSGTTFYLNR